MANATICDTINQEVPTNKRTEHSKFMNSVDSKRTRVRKLSDYKIAEKKYKQ